MRVRDMKSLSLLERFGLAPRSLSWSGGRGCLSWDEVEVEKRFPFAKGESELVFISTSWGGV